MAQPVELPSKIEVGPVIDEGHSLASVSDKIAGIVLKRKITIGWVFGFLIAFSVLQLLMGAASWLIIKGVGIWGINIPIGWGFAIVNFVWWIGIGHAGTLISAILFLLNQKWRTSITRFAEAMTLFAVACAGLFPLIHTGRPWMAYYMFPYPSTMGIWPQFRSPLIWHVFAVVLVRRANPRPRDVARPRHRQTQADHLRHAGHGLEGLGASLAPLPVGVLAARGPGHAAGAVRAHRRELRLFGGHRSRMAHHHFPAVL